MQVGGMCGVDEEPSPGLFLQPSSVSLLLDADFPVSTCMSLSTTLPPVSSSSPTLMGQTTGMRSTSSSGIPYPKVLNPHLTPSLGV